MIHASHKDHSMRLFPRPATVLCDACDVKKEDFFYHCLSCIYQIHRSCALLQSTTNREDHPHPLTLSFGLPSLYHHFDFYCDVCVDKLDKSQKKWLYYCKLCRYFVHIKCMEYQTHQGPTYGPNPELDIIYFPTADKSKDLIQRFLLGNKKFVDIPQEIQIFKHPLILSNEQITEDVIEDDEEILCDGCIEPISSPPYYHCVQCRYFLHLPCANLPRNFRDPIRHTLFTLGSKSRFYDDFTCHRYSRISNGFYFGCEFDGDHIYLDHLNVKLVTFIFVENVSKNIELMS
ncbi:hypothetical protein LIER_06467 [Lithospermum erythrorhizon]|uniref:DC1 domain-containing protein n=1 Tax=Lithospermum erythrorhizon TaxID=34254 RepID=A0AAV3P8Z1_LITER